MFEIMAEFNNLRIIKSLDETKQKSLPIYRFYFFRRLTEDTDLEAHDNRLSFLIASIEDAEFEAYKYHSSFHHGFH